MDIHNRSDIELIIQQFYKKAVEDPQIGTFFTDVVQLNWEKHMPIMYDFWENILFASGKYRGNPMLVHRNIHSIQAITHDHFQRWLELFRTTVEELYEGKNARMMIQRAEQIAVMMEIKINAK